jgi:hypothetical protein
MTLSIINQRRETIMKKIHLISCAVILSLLLGLSQESSAQLFKQDFSNLILTPVMGVTATSATLVDPNYVSATPSNSQFTSITATGTAATTYSVVYDSAGYLVMGRVGAGYSALTRSVPFSPMPTSLIVKFDYNNVNYKGGTAPSSQFSFNIGTTYTDDAVSRPSAGFAKFGIGYNKPDSTWSVYNINASTVVQGPTKFTSLKTVTFVVNNTGATLTYAAPNGTQETVANQMWDLWVGTSKEFDEQPIFDNTQTMSCFKITLGSASSSIMIDNLVIDKVGGSTAVASTVLGAPASFDLQQNYPNPFNPSTQISYSLAKAGVTTLKVYNILGKEVATLVDGMQPQGFHAATFNASTLPSGVYLSVLNSGGQKITKAMVLMK